jgi:hypothetical protein
VDPFVAGLIATPFAAVILYLSPHMFAAIYGGMITGQFLTASLQRTRGPKRN